MKCNVCNGMRYVKFLGPRGFDERSCPLCNDNELSPDEADKAKSGPVRYPLRETKVEMTRHDAEEMFQSVFKRGGTIKETLDKIFGEKT